ncbi:hypothetical protein EVAR_95883_1 [Eumeta japonica]|uniref:Uncharacterized protein n=1 Tax=Eumeta variegata TaxID=151549 RepID=A0A4C1VLI6_EUMVA|nr:hypothetical protein EVAR_95883_1 [Eumeta japonica]
MPRESVIRLELRVRYEKTKSRCHWDASGGRPCAAVAVGGTFDAAGGGVAGLAASRATPRSRFLSDWRRRGEVWSEMAGNVGSILAYSSLEGVYSSGGNRRGRASKRKSHITPRSHWTFTTFAGTNERVPRHEEVGPTSFSDDENISSFPSRGTQPFNPTSQSPNPIQRNLLPPTAAASTSTSTLALPSAANNSAKLLLTP